MLKELEKKFANVLRESVELFKSFCEVCQEKTKRKRTKGVVVRPILSHEFASRGQVDLIDFQSMQDGQYRWIMVYQDHLTKFVVLRPLSSKRASEVALQLVDIFNLIGAPVILQSDNGSEFTAFIIRELREIWPELKIVHGKPRHPQSQGSVERANSDIKDMLIAWMTDNQTTGWSLGLRFVQFAKNRSHSAGIGRSPYLAMFGVEPRVGLSSTSLPTWQCLEWNQEWASVPHLCLPGNVWSGTKSGPQFHISAYLAMFGVEPRVGLSSTSLPTWQCLEWNQEWASVPHLCLWI
ncbi:hypothetical protein V1264_004994 [Littorina saxatilis]|uniref:Integrase catalytic domain-containing protein n=1 Tax=Littorina saxatilis TaxID=31220 RepID=A0AAN9B0H0_9CAEN